MNQPCRIQALTSLRFFAALLVVVFHHGQALVANAPEWLQNVVKGGYIGVPFFFVLSGFILAVTYFPRLGEAGLDTRAFWAARFARIYPAYAVSLVLSLPFVMASSAVVAREGVGGGLTTLFQCTAAVTLLQAWIPAWAFAWNGPAWSLSVEAFFYATFPLLVRCNARTRLRALAVLAMMVAGAWIFGRSLFGFDLVREAQRLLGWANPLLWLPLFLLGIHLGEMHLSPACSVLRRRSSGKISAIATVGLAAGILLLMVLDVQRYSQLLYCYAVAPLCAGIIYCLADERNPVARLMAIPPLVLLGEASYSLYILHRPIHDWLAWSSTHGFVRLEGSGPALFYVMGCVLISVVAFKTIECSCREWLRRHFQNPSTKAVQVLRQPTVPSV